VSPLNYLLVISCSPRTKSWRRHCISLYF